MIDVMEGDGGMSQANDNTEPPPDPISFTDLCAAMGEDEDTVLQRLVGILAKRPLPALTGEASET